MTERQPGPDRGHDSPKSPRATPRPAAEQRIPDRSGSTPDEQSLFNTDSAERVFGEGSYVEGGQNQEGNFKEREASPRGARGSLDDAGGPGGKELLGGKRADEAAERAHRSNDKTGPDETIEDT